MIASYLWAANFFVWIILENWFSFWLTTSENTHITKARFILGQGLQVFSLLGWRLQAASTTIGPIDGGQGGGRGKNLIFFFTCYCLIWWRLSKVRWRDPGWDKAVHSMTMLTQGHWRTKQHQKISCCPWTLNKNICIVAEVTKYPQQERCYFFYLSGKSFLKRCNVSKIDLRSEIYHRCENYKIILLPVVKSKRQHFIINFVASFK